MPLYSYIVKKDGGFAPNPFFGYCTLACCKPVIRRKAKRGDWIVGLTPKADGYKIVYFMKVKESLGFDEYWRDQRFKEKKANLHGGMAVKCGDNIYQPSKRHSLGYRQLPSAHSDGPFGKCEDPERKERDLKGKQVLVSKRFVYFGSDPQELPPKLRETLGVGRGYRRLSGKVAAEFQSYIRRRKWSFGVHARPGLWKTDDKSWKGVACGNR